MEDTLNVVRVFVSDWERAIRLYTERLGMAVAYRSADMGWAQMATGEGQFALERVDSSDEEGRALGRALRRRLARGRGYLRNLRDARRPRSRVHGPAGEATMSSSTCATPTATS